MKERMIRMPKLDIIVTHYNEPWRDGQKFFDMLALQRGVNIDDYRVIFIQDGTGSPFKPMVMLRKYPFTIAKYEISHGGVSVARNMGMRMSGADWVMFCDFDDMLYSCDSLHRILTSIDQAGDKADLLWAPFWMEQYDRKGVFHKTLKEWNSIFNHGKVYRLRFLRENHISFEPSISYSEDALFNATVCMCISPERIARIPETTYMWCHRQESLSSSADGQAQRNNDLYTKRVLLCEEYMKRGNAYEADCAAARAILDYYWELAGTDHPPAGATAEEWNDRVRFFFRQYPGWSKISTRDGDKLCDVARDEAFHKGFFKIGMPTVTEWLSNLYMKEETADEHTDHPYSP